MSINRQRVEEKEAVDDDGACKGLMLAGDLIHKLFLPPSKSTCCPPLALPFAVQQQII
jgi:hypothetical protein